MKIKDDFHYLVNNDQNGYLWNSLNKDEKEELFIAYKESFDSKNPLSHEQGKLQREKLLNP